jgi:hypothetical protein
VYGALMDVGCILSLCLYALGLWGHIQGTLRVLPPTSCSDDVQSKTRLDLSTKSETCWSSQQAPSRESGSQYHWMTSTSKPLIHYYGHPSLKILNCCEYLEPKAHLFGFMKNFEWFHLVLSMSGPFTLSIFFILETKVTGGDSFTQREVKQQKIWKI